jgi:Flp pilus assembly protein TadD
MALRTLLTLVLLCSALVTPISADARGDARRQVDFGIEVARQGLWREAIYRWERAVELDPTYAEAYNNLAIAYEHDGDLDKAAGAYEKALALEPNNPSIRQNYELFEEINERTTAANGS